MRFDLLDFFLEADEEDSKKDDDKEKEDKKDDDKDEKKDDKKEEKDDSDAGDSDEYNDLLDDDIDSSDTDDSSSDEDLDKDDEYNDLIGDDDEDLGDLTGDDIDSSSSEDSSSGDDYNALIMVKSGGEECCGSEGGMYEKLAKLGYVFTVIANNMKHIHLNTTGRKFEEIHRQSEGYYNHFNYSSDLYFEIAAESPVVKIDNPTRSKEHVEDIEVETAEAYPFETAVARMSANLSKAIEYVKDARMAASARTDVQSSLDNELAYLNKEVNFILRRKMMNDDTTSTTDLDATTESYNWLF